MFDEDALLKEGQEILIKVEESVRMLKVEYQKALADYNQLKTGDPEVFEEMEPRYLKLLSKIQKSITDTTDLWDATIASIEKMKAKKKTKTEYFLTGVLWTLDEAKVAPEKKKEIIELAKRLAR